MKAGKLRHKITIQYPSETRNDFGEVTSEWHDLVSLRAARRDLSGRQYWDAQHIHSEITTEFIIRPYPGIKSKFRIVDNSGAVFEIISPPLDPKGRGRELVLKCKIVE